MSELIFFLLGFVLALAGLTWDSRKEERGHKKHLKKLNEWAKTKEGRESLENVFGRDE